MTGAPDPANTIVSRPTKAPALPQRPVSIVGRSMKDYILELGDVPVRLELAG